MCVMMLLFSLSLSGHACFNLSLFLSRLGVSKCLVVIMA